MVVGRFSDFNLVIFRAYVHSHKNVWLFVANSG